MFSALFSANNINSAAATAPGPPLDPTLTAGNALITLSWTAPSSDGGSAITGYRVQYSSNSGSTWSALTDAGLPNPLSYTWSGLSNGTTYIARVLAYNSVGDGDVSANSNSAIPSTVPGVPLNPSLSAGDKSITFTWSAPSSDGGSAITGYRVQYSTNGGSSWSALANAGLPSPLTYTWSGNQVIFNGSSYTARVLAYNSNGDGSVSGSSNAAVPTFAAPTIVSAYGTAGYPSTGAPFSRPFYINFTPTACANYSSTYIYVQSATYESFGGYYASVNGAYDNLYTTSTGNQNTGNIFSVYAQNVAMGGQFYSNGTSQTFYMYAVTYNNDGYGVSSSAISYTTVATQSYYTYSGTQGLYNAGQFTVNSGTYSGILGSISSNDWYVQTIYIRARTSTLSSSYGICSGSRYFTVRLNYPGSGYVQQFNGNGTPFNAAGSGISERNTTVDISDIGYDSYGFGAVNVRGVGSFTTATRILVNTTVNGIVRTLNYY